MVEFNPDGSIKLPGIFSQQKEENKIRMQSQRYIKIVRSTLSFKPPKRCLLQITLSQAINENLFVSNLYKLFKERASTPTSFKQINDKEFEVEIGTNFRRCSDCTSLIYGYREFLDGKVIEEKGQCTFEKRINDNDVDY